MDKIRIDMMKKLQAAGKVDEMSFKFKVMNSDEHRVLMILTIMDTFGMIPNATCEVKNSKMSIKLRNEANRVFVSSKDNVDMLIKAWEMYSKSIAAAPNKSEELSLAFANRSAVLIKLHKYTECIQDINRALELNYPNNLKGKLLYRKIECLKIFNGSNNSNEIDTVLDELTSWLENIHLDDVEKQKYNIKFNFTKNVNFSKTPKSKNIKDLPKIKCNPQIPCASDALALKVNNKYGRHIVTTRNIEPGEILIIETPFATILLPEEVYTHCSHCLQQHWAMIPCDLCVNAMYCSEKCKKEAWNQYHDIECSIVGYLLNLGYNQRSLFSMRLAILALREAGDLKKLKCLTEKADKCSDPYKRGFSEDGIYHSDKYCALYTLVTNTDKRSVSDLFERALNAAFILYYLYTKTTLFGKKYDPVMQDLIMNEDITYIGGVIMRHMQIIPSNIHSYSEERGVENVCIGAAALPFCSLINHSCDPNVSRCTTKDYITIYAVVPIEKGAQIYDSYGIHYAVMNKSERKEKLKQFYFECECKACTKDWPIYNYLPSFNDLLKDKNVKKIIIRSLEKFNDYVNYAMIDQIEDKPYALTDLQNMINTLFKYVPLPCRDVNSIIETLKRVFALTYGNQFEFPQIN